MNSQDDDAADALLNLLRSLNREIRRLKDALIALEKRVEWLESAVEALSRNQRLDQ